MIDLTVSHDTPDLTQSAEVSVLYGLMGLAPERFAELLAALTISRCATRYAPGRVNLGDNAMALAAWAFRPAAMALPRPHKAYLSTLDYAALTRLAAANGLEDPSFRLLNRSDKIKALDKHFAANGVRRIPPDLAFASRSNIEADLREEGGALSPTS